MVLALVLGDLHIPQRAAHIHEAFRKMFIPGRIQMVFVTGNVTSKEMIQYLYSIAPEVYCTRGEFDQECLKDLPESLVVDVEGIKVGLIHGHQIVPMGDRDSLAAVQRQMDIDVLISGGTHQAKIIEFDAHLFVNPGSATGAFTPYDLNVIPSFVLLDIHNTSVNAFTYRYITEDDTLGEGDAAGEKHLSKDECTGVRIHKREWTKG
ncbi:unnamed protein product [Phytomonas sp. Hart1]|nr:unnamed protein product [Phytomonas sp. Hart1]|eukprot:CCW70601.1 unnamed protein product [Phytomonas sp. isolate Hart1]